MKRKIVVTGGTGRFAKILKKIKSNYVLLYPNKKELNITNFNKIKSYLKKKKPDVVIHLAGLSRPMVIHEKNVSKSVALNIIGTANLVRACSELNIKIVYFSTSYVYPGTKGNYKESDPVLPWNNYAWSKLGGECAVRMYKNSLILRVCMTEKPFIHKKAFTNVKLNFAFHEDIAKILFKLIKRKGILNLGGKTRTAFNFAKKHNPKVKKIRSKGEFPLNPYMNLSKLKKIVN
tara:strand:- start:7031 stop:7729 length:699 start_codon:yes stop_codon:yes gene_type:complete